jgi:imidazole glycerol-phosphate synthase subunit HisF
MLSIRVIPILLFKGEGLCKGVRFADHKYVGDAINAVRIFNARQVDEVILVDIGATEVSRCIATDLVARISNECLMPLTVGGGLRSVDEVKTILNAGAEKVTLNTHAITNPSLVREVADQFGSQSVVIAIDAKRRNYGFCEVFTNGGTKGTGRSAIDMAREMAEAGAGEILLTSIDRDGTGSGYDLDLIRDVSAAVTIPVIACGGAGEFRHFAEATTVGGAAAVCAGSLFVFHGARRAVLVNFPERYELDAAFGNASSNGF